MTRSLRKKGGRPINLLAGCDYREFLSLVAGN